MNVFRSVLLPGLALFGAAILSQSARGDGRAKPSGSMAEAQRNVRSVILRWNAAYRLRDAKSLAALESADVEIVDRFGELHHLTDRKNSEGLWADTFEQLSDQSTAPECTIEKIRFIDPGVAIVYVRARYAGGIAFSDGARMPPYKQG
jgi:ketosteroid isomerase-like protein